MGLEENVRLTAILADIKGAFRDLKVLLGTSRWLLGGYLVVFDEANLLTNHNSITKPRETLCYLHST